MKKTQDYIRELLTMFFIRKNIIVTITVLFSLGSLAVVMFWPRQYQASGALLLKENKVQKSPESIEDVRKDIPLIKESNLFSEMQVFQSEDVIEKTVDFLRDNNIMFQEYKSSSKKYIKLREEIESKLSTTLFPNSNVFQVNLIWSDPLKAKTILENFIEQYLDYRDSIYTPKKAEKFFREQLERFEDKLMEAENKLIELAKSSDSFSQQNKIENNLTLEMDLKKQINQLIPQLIKYKKKVSHLKKALSSSEIKLFSMTDNLNIIKLNESLRNFIEEKANLEAIYNPNSKKIQKVNKKIDKIYGYLEKEMKMILEDESNKVDVLQKQIDDLKQRVAAVSETNMNLFESSILAERIIRNKKLYEESYSTFHRRLEEAIVSKTANTDRLFSVSVVNRAKASLTPIFPQMNALPVGIFLGIVMGLMVAFLLEFFDHTFKRPEDVSNATGMDTICSLPHYS